MSQHPPRVLDRVPLQNSVSGFHTPHPGAGPYCFKFVLDWFLIQASPEISTSHTLSILYKIGIRIIISDKPALRQGFFIGFTVDLLLPLPLLVAVDV
jgi:hypothetical protein